MSGRDIVESSGIIWSRDEDEQQQQTVEVTRKGTTWVEVTHPLGIVLDPTRKADPVSWLARGFADPTPCAECSGTGVVVATTGEDFTCYRCVKMFPYVKQGVRYAESDLGNPHPSATATAAGRREVDKNAYHRALGPIDIPDKGHREFHKRWRKKEREFLREGLRDFLGEEEEKDDEQMGDEQMDEQKDYTQKDYDDAEELMIQNEAKETRDYEQRMSWQRQHPEVDEKGNSPSRIIFCPPAEKEGPGSSSSSIPNDPTCGGTYLLNSPGGEEASHRFAERIALPQKRKGKYLDRSQGPITATTPTPAPAAETQESSFQRTGAETAAEAAAEKAYLRAIRKYHRLPCQCGNEAAKGCGKCGKCCPGCERHGRMEDSSESEEEEEKESESEEEKVEENDTDYHDDVIKDEDDFNERMRILVMMLRPKKELKKKKQEKKTQEDKEPWKIQKEKNDRAQALLDKKQQEKQQDKKSGKTEKGKSKVEMNEEEKRKSEMEEELK